MASGGSSTLALILGVTITLVVLVAIIIIIIFMVFGFFIIRNRKPTQHVRENLKQEHVELERIEREHAKLEKERECAKLEIEREHAELERRQQELDEQERRMGRDHIDDEKEKPLGDSSEIKIPKKRISNIDYDDFFNRVQYIFLTRNENTFNAATTILAAPDVEKTTDQRLTSIDKGVYIGMIGQHQVCLVNETNNFVKKLEDVIIKYFSNAKFVVFVGRCFGIDKTKLELADVVISKRIRHAIEHHSHTDRIAPEIRSKFCFFSDEVEGLGVTKGRKAKHFVAKLVSGVNILENHDYRKDALIASDEIFGCEETSGELLSLFKTGINMGNNTTKHMQVITIGAVSGYANKDTVTKYDDWQFIASQAAFHYVSNKMKHPHTPGDISYEIKKPKPMNKNDTYAELVKYIIVTIGSDELNAVRAYISAQELKEDIIERDKDVYIGMIGSYSVGLLYLRNKMNYCVDMKNAIDKYFPHTEYLIHVGGCAGIHQSTKLGDVMISKEIYNIHYDGASYSVKTIEITSDIFCNSRDVKGLRLPGNRTAKHFEVRIATGTGSYIGNNEYMKRKAIEDGSIYGYDVIGGALIELQEEMKSIERKIHFILINGVCRYKYSKDYDEWDFIASQAAIHYVAAEIKKQ